MGAMATPGFPPPSQSLRSAPSSQAAFPAVAPMAPNGHASDRDVLRSMAAAGPFGSSPPAAPVRALIRRLPLGSTEESLRLMLVWSKELTSVEMLPARQTEDEGFRSAILSFRSMSAAMEVKNMLDGTPNISNNADMIVELLTPSPSLLSSYPDSYTDDLGSDNPSMPLSAASVGTSASSAIGSGRQSAMNGHAMRGMSISSQHPDLFASQVSEHQLPPTSQHGSMNYHNVFSPTSPIGSHLRSDRTRVSGKSLIENNLTDDDETSVLLKDPVAYAESRPPTGRRATAPQIPITRMSNLTLNTNGAPPSTSVPTPYSANPMSAHPMSATPNMNGAAPGGGTGRYPMGNHHYRSHFPPINPADQNPPCNTLYVGNLPVGTSEDELKLMFSKQRGYKRLCFRTKHNGPMCFVEFEDVTFATKALHELYGHPLHNSVKGGIRLSFSKNPLGVRSQHNTGSAHPGPGMGSINATMNAAMNGTSGGPMNGAMGGAMSSIMGGGGALNSAAGAFSAANGPPPGLSAPPGLPGRVNYMATTNGNHAFNGAGAHAW